MVDGPHFNLQRLLLFNVSEKGNHDFLFLLPAFAKLVAVRATMKPRV